MRDGINPLVVKPLLGEVQCVTGQTPQVKGVILTNYRHITSQIHGVKII